MVTVRRRPSTERLAGIPGGTPGTITRDPTRDPRTERVTITASQLATGPNGDGLVVSGRVPRGQEQAFLGGRREFWVPAGTPWVTVAPRAQPVTRTARQPRPQTPPLVTVPRTAPRGPGISIPNPLPVIRFFQRLTDPFGGT